MLWIRSGWLRNGTSTSPFGSHFDLSHPCPARIALNSLDSAPTPGNLVVNGNFDEGVSGWEARSDYYDYGATETFTSSDGFALHAAGEMRLRVLRNEPAAPQRLSLRQAVSLQAGQRYRLSVDARAEAPRAVRLVVQGADAAYGSIVSGPDVETFTVDGEMRNFQAVFESPATDAAAGLVFQFGHSSEDVIIDNVILEPTELPLDPGDGSLGSVGDLGADVSGRPCRLSRRVGRHPDCRRRRPAIPPHSTPRTALRRRIAPSSISATTRPMATCGM